MHISWLGFSCFKIQTKENIIITDPYSDKSGLKMPKLKADIILVSDRQNELCNNVDRLSGENFLINQAGEYEIKENLFYAIPAGEADQNKNLIFQAESEGMTIGFLGLLNHSLSNEQLETIEGVDILFLPVSSLTSERRTKIISQIEPRIVIPMYYQLPKTKIKLESIEKFAKEMGQKKIEFLDKIVLKKKDLPQEETRVIFLKALN
jgi:L-ascorbate metabolism protein UlaG (beta-lactamase superfamily)